MPKRLLFVDDEPSLRLSLAAVLRMHGFQVTTASTVVEALQKITSEKFEILLSDLNIGNPGDGLTVVSAMRRTQPEAVTMILTGYPAFETALEAIRQQVDDYIVKPADIPTLISTIESKLATPSRQGHLPPPKRVSMVLHEHIERIHELWTAAMKEDGTLSKLSLTREQRFEHRSGVVEEVIRAGQSYSGEEYAEPMHLAAPDFAGYTPLAMLIEFSLLRRSILQVVQENLLVVNLSYLVSDLARVNESIDRQAQTALAALSEHSSVHWGSDRVRS